MPTAAIIATAMIASSVAPNANAVGSSIFIGCAADTPGPTVMQVESDESP